MGMFRMWGRGEDLQAAYRVARWCLVGVAILVVSNLVPLYLKIFHPQGLEWWVEEVTWYILPARFLLQVGVLLGGMWCLHQLSILAERAKVYAGMLSKPLALKVTPPHPCDCGVKSPRFGAITIR